MCRSTDRGLILMMALITVMGSATAQQQRAPKEPASAPLELSGEQMFKSYCATCHGSDAKGNGPMASALKVPPPDLTTLLRHNNGKFPADYIATVLKNGVNMSAHGTAEMPIWGSVFVDIKTRRIVTVRISDLTRYLESVQVK